MKSSKFFLIALALWAGPSLYSQMQDTSMIVNGVCGMCERVIEKAAHIEGVKNAQWDKNTKILKFSYLPAKVSLMEVSESINRSGYDTEFNTAPDSAYFSLHACCYYRDPEVVKDHEKKEQ